LPLQIEEAEKVRGLFGERAVDVALEEIDVVIRLLCDQRVSGVQGGVGGERGNVSTELVGAWLGEDLDSAVTNAVELSREGILVDADLADRGLGG
jgi:hypothetical protein